MASEIHTNLAQDVTVAFVPIEDAASLARKYDVGRAATAYLSTKLVEKGGIQLVDRTQLEGVMRELELGRSDSIDLESAVRTGRLLSAQVLLSGSITSVGRVFNVNVRAVDVETGRIMRSFTAEVDREVFIDEDSAMSRRNAERIQIGLDVLDRAIVGYYRLSYDQRQNEFRYPTTLDELVPNYLDRLPDPVRGEWLYEPATGQISHSLYTDLRPTAPRINLQPYADQARRTSVRTSLREIEIALEMHMAETGELPERLSELEGSAIPELPESFGGSWTWSKDTGSLGHSGFPDLEIRVR